MRIVILDGYALNPGDLSYDPLKQLGELVVYDRTKNEDIIKRIGNANIIFTNKTPITKEILDECKNIEYIGAFATGYNVIDVEYAKKKEIIVTNVPAYSSDAVAQMTFALLLEMCNRVGEHSESVKNGDWSKSKDFCYWNAPLVELRGKTLGIIGMGQIGMAVAKIANAFNMKVIYNSRTKKDINGYVDIDTLYRESDVITLHCPLLDSTKDIINKDSINKMKDSVKIINTSRGGLVVEEDVKEALNSGKISGFACDVAKNEPINVSSPLLSTKNIYITPHISWAPYETRKRLLDIAVNNLVSYLNNNPINIVNK